MTSSTGLIVVVDGDQATGDVFDLLLTNERETLCSNHTTAAGY